MPKILSRSTLQRKLRAATKDTSRLSALVELTAGEALDLRKQVRMEIGTRDALRENLAAGKKQFEELRATVATVTLDRDAARHRAEIHERSLTALAGRTTALAACLEIAIQPEGQAAVLREPLRIVAAHLMNNKP